MKLSYHDGETAKILISEFMTIMVKKIATWKALYTTGSTASFVKILYPEG
jgi:hypothetical protein